MSDTDAEPAVGDRWSVGRPVDEPTGIVAPRRPRRGWIVLTALLAVTTVVLSLVLADVAADRDTLAGRLDDRDLVAGVAGALTEALFSIDGGDLDAGRERVLALATGNLEAEFEEFLKGAVGEQFAALGASSTADVTEIYVGDVGDDTASAVAVMDQEVVSEDGTQRFVDRYLVLTLVRTTSGWKVDRVLTVRGGTDAPSTPSSPSS